MSSISMQTAEQRTAVNGKRRAFAVLVFGFVLASFGGWIYEEICVWLLYHMVVNRGMLHLTLCPIYGFGAWGLYLLLRKVKSGALFFVLSVLIASAFEYACSYLLEWAFHRVYWTYADWPFSVQDRISLVSSLIFGVLAVLFAKGILPLLRKYVRKGNAWVWFGAAMLIVAVIAVDFVLVLFSYRQ